MQGLEPQGLLHHRLSHRAKSQSSVYFFGTPQSWHKSTASTTSLLHPYRWSQDRSWDAQWSSSGTSHVSCSNNRQSDETTSLHNAGDVINHGRWHLLLLQRRDLCCVCDGIVFQTPEAFLSFRHIFEEWPLSRRQSRIHHQVSQSCFIHGYTLSTFFNSNRFKSVFQWKRRNASWGVRRSSRFQAHGCYWFAINFGVDCERIVKISKLISHWKHLDSIQSDRWSAKWRCHRVFPLESEWQCFIVQLFTIFHPDS